MSRSAIKPGSLFAVATLLAIGGGSTLFLASQFSFTLGFPGGTSLLFFSIGAIVAAAICNSAATIWGFAHVLSRRRMPWWWPISLLAAVGSIAEGLVLLQR